MSSSWTGEVCATGAARAFLALEFSPLSALRGGDLGKIQCTVPLCFAIQVRVSQWNRCCQCLGQVTFGRFELHETLWFLAQSGFRRRCWEPRLCEGCGFARLRSNASSIVKLKFTCVHCTAMAASMLWMAALVDAVLV